MNLIRQSLQHLQFSQDSGGNSLLQQLKGHFRSRGGFLRELYRGGTERWGWSVGKTFNQPAVSLVPTVRETSARSLLPQPRPRSRSAREAWSRSAWGQRTRARPGGACLGLRGQKDFTTVERGGRPNLVNSRKAQASQGREGKREATPTSRKDGRLRATPRVGAARSSLAWLWSSGFLRQLPDLARRSFPSACLPPLRSGVVARHALRPSL